MRTTLNPGDGRKTSIRLDEEREREMELDRAYWAPLRKELEALIPLLSLTRQGQSHKLDLVLRSWTALICILFLAVIGSCDRDPTGPLSQEPMIVGLISDLGTDVGSARTLGMLVEEVPGKPCPDPDVEGCGKVVFYLSPLETTVRIVDEDAARFASITELQLGQRVRVWSRGIILLSYPPQTGAGQVDILEP